MTNKIFLLLGICMAELCVGIKTDLNNHMCVIKKKSVCIKTIS